MTQILILLRKGVMDKHKDSEKHFKLCVKYIIILAFSLFVRAA